MNPYDNPSTSLPPQGPNPNGSDPFQAAAPQPVQQPQVQQASPQQIAPAPQPVPAQTEPAPSPINYGNINPFLYILRSILKPVSTYRQHEEQVSTASFSLITAAIVIVSSVVLNLIATLVSSMRVVETSFFARLMGEEPTVTWTTEPWGDLPYLQLILVPIVSYAVIIFAIALGYFVMTKIFKSKLEQVPYWRLVSILAVSYAPLVVVAGPLSVFLQMWGVDFLGYVAIILNLLAASYVLAVLASIVGPVISKEPSDHAVYAHVMAISIVSIIASIAVLSMLGGPEIIQTMFKAFELANFAL